MLQSHKKELDTHKESDMIKTSFWTELGDKHTLSALHNYKRLYGDKVIPKKQKKSWDEFKKGYNGERNQEGCFRSRKESRMTPIWLAVG